MNSKNPVSFSTDFYPPAPVLEVHLSNPETSATSSTVIALLDTGADLTVVPIQLLDQIMVVPVSYDRVRGLWGGLDMVPIFEVDLQVNGQTFFGIEVVGSKRDPDLLIGRNVSNRLRIFLDGPQQTLELVPDD